LGKKGLVRFAALAMTFALSGCVTAENSLSANDIASMKLTGVAVSFAPNAFVQWEDGGRAYAASKGGTDSQILGVAQTPESKVYVQNLLASRVKAGVERVMAGQLNGPRPVRLEVVVKRFDLPPPLQSIVIGGGRGMTADANLVDARTGALILANVQMSAVMPSGGGLLGSAVQAAIDNGSEQGPADKLITLYGENYRNWLLRQS
jgi:hypothetical protein